MGEKRLIRTGATGLLAIAAVTLTGCGSMNFEPATPPRPTTDDLVRAEGRHQVCTALTPDNFPQDPSTTVPRAGKVYLHSTWTGLPERDILNSVELRDSTGLVAYTADARIAPADGRWVTFSWYSFRPSDPPGLWRFTTSLDGLTKEHVEFVVRDVPGGRGSGAAPAPAPVAPPEFPEPEPMEPVAPLPLPLVE